MGDKTTIEWTEATWNPVTGCTKVTAGCDNCYAETLHERFHGRGSFATVVRNEDKLYTPLTWRKPRRVFVNSMSDLFHDDIPEGFIARVFATMARTPQHTYQLLTKRHGRMRSLLGRDSFRDNLLSLVPGAVWPLPNLWLGVSTEDQDTAAMRIHALLATPAAVRWISAEPLLGPIDLRNLQVRGNTFIDALDGDVKDDRGVYAACPSALDWVVVGGESGPKARPMHPVWARSLRDQCTAAGVPFFFKQWGSWGPAQWRVPVCDPAEGWTGTAEELAAAKTASEAMGATHSYAVWADQYGHQPCKASHKPWSLERTFLDETQQAPMRLWGKKRAGRELDGRTWDQYPAVTR